MPVIHIHLLGEFQLTSDEIQHREFARIIKQPRLQALLAYLLLHRHTPQLRQHLAFRFWPDSSEAQALTNLRKQLLLLRRALPEIDQFLKADTKVIQWIPDTPFTLDVAEFELAVIRSTTQSDDLAIASLKQAVELYRNDLLPGCYDEWIIPQREALQASFSQALERLIGLLEICRNYPAAIQMAQRLLHHDPLCEPTYLALMRLHALNGNRVAALQVYRTCLTRLQNELGIAPSADLQAAYSRLLQHDLSIGLPAKPSVSHVAQSPFIGRQREWQTLQATWCNVAKGHAHFILIAGEAGIGKTRLAEELRYWAASQGILTAHTRTYAAEGRLAYAPLIEWLRTPALKARLSQLDAVSLTELARLLPELLNERPGLPAPNPIIENWQRHLLFEALTRAILAGRQPLLLVLDDLQWCDQETLEWLHFMLRHNADAPLLILGTARSEEMGPRHPSAALRSGLRNNQQLTEIQLATLTDADTLQLAQEMVGEDLDPAWAQRLYRDTEGNPLFVVEIVRAGLSRAGEVHLNGGDSSVTALHSDEPTPLPFKVKAVIESRLSQLTPVARKLTELAATIGRDFTFDVLIRASETREDEVVEGLDELWQQHIVREQRANVYDFSHDKIREVVYEQISAPRRRLLHRRVAQVLEAMYAANLDQVTGQLAAHYEKAGFPVQALPYYRQAAQWSFRIYANHEAIDHFKRGLALLASMSDDENKFRQELTFLLGLGPALVVTQGYGVSQVHEVYTRAQMLTHQLGEPPNSAILRALALFYIARRQYAETFEQGKQILTLANHTSDRVDPILYVEGHYVLGVTAFWEARFLQSKDHLEQALAAYDTQRHGVHIAQYTQDPGVVCLIRLAHLLWFLGYPNQAQQRCGEALGLARKLAHPYSLGYALYFAALLHNDARNLRMAQNLVDEATVQGRKQELQYWLPTGRFLQGWLLVERGEIDTGIAEIRASIRASENTQQDIFRPYSLAMLAQAQTRAGATGQGLASLDEGLATTQHHGDHWYDAELHRLKGELLDKLEVVPSIVEACFQQAYSLAHAQHAKSLELRAAMSLSRFWHRHGKREQARQLLAETYGWFTEGFDTADLREAKALLDALS